MIRNLPVVALRHTRTVASLLFVAVVLLGVVTGNIAGRPARADVQPPVYSVCLYADNTCENCAYSNPKVSTWCYNIANDYWGDCDSDLLFSKTPCTQGSGYCSNLYDCSDPPRSLDQNCAGSGGQFNYCSN